MTTRQTNTLADLIQLVITDEEAKQGHTLNPSDRLLLIEVLAKVLFAGTTKFIAGAKEHQTVLTETVTFDHIFEELFDGLVYNAGMQKRITSAIAK